MGVSKTLGKDYDSRLLSREVRDLALTEIKDILLNKKKVEKRFREQLVLKLAGNVLPRLNELSGADGEVLQIKFDGRFNVKTPQKTNGDNTKSS